ncbi:MAG: hypothetical protein QGG14_01575 [Planctomycetota bacterium]|nr:hypothetical protein [Planctomycetota bacterium]
MIASLSRASSGSRCRNATSPIRLTKPEADLAGPARGVLPEFDTLRLLACWTSPAASLSGYLRML